MLAVSYAGHVLTPLVVFKATPGGRVERVFGNSDLDYPTNCFYCVQPNAWCDQRVMDYWASTVFNPYIENSKGGDSYQNSLLLMDNFSVHCTLETSKEIAKSETRMLLLPPNTTSKTQILDVGINKPLKVAMRKKWETWMATGGIVNGTAKEPSRQQVANWLVDAYTNIPTNVCRNAWKEAEGYGATVDYF